MSSVNTNQFAKMFKEVFGANQITKTAAESKGIDTSEVEENTINADTAYADKDMQEYVIAQYDIKMDELDKIPEEEEQIKPTTGEGSKADV